MMKYLSLIIPSSALRGISEKNAINDLASKIDPSMFLDRFGADVSQLR